MVKTIRITAGNIEALAELNDTATAEAIWAALPITGEANLWGDEIYFSVPVDAGPEKGREVVDAGDLGYWPPGNAFCIFFGRTPASRGDEVRPASAVNVFGKLSGDFRVFKDVAGGAAVKIVKAEQD